MASAFYPGIASCSSLFTSLGVSAGNVTQCCIKHVATKLRVQRTNPIILNLASSKTPHSLCLLLKKCLWDKV